MTLIEFLFWGGHTLLKKKKKKAGFMTDGSDVVSAEGKEDE